MMLPKRKPPPHRFLTYEMIKIKLGMKWRGRKEKKKTSSKPQKERLTNDVRY